MERFNYQLDVNSDEYEIMDHQQGAGQRGVNPVAVVYDAVLAQLLIDTLNERNAIKKVLPFNRRTR